MKKPIVCATLLWCVSSFAVPSEDSYIAVTNDWRTGNFSNVYELAQLRLAANSNDVVGAYLMLDWDVAFSDIGAMSASMTRVIAVSDAVCEPAFSNAYFRLRDACLEYRDEYLPLQTEEQRRAEQVKSYLPNRFLSTEGMLRILWDKGLW